MHICSIMFELRVISAICLLLKYLCLYSKADGSVTPSNIAVVAGNWMVMECRVTSGRHVFVWEHRRPWNRRTIDIFKNHDERRSLTAQYRSRFGVDMDESCSGLLYTNSTQLEDAGLYFCHSIADNHSQPMAFSAHLIVFETLPICETNYTAEDNVTLRGDEIIWMQCTVNFSGMWAPTFEWKQNTKDNKRGEGDEQIVVHGISTDTVLNTSITTSLVFDADFNETTYFSCRMFFQWHNGSVIATAKNLPNFTYTWESQILQPPRVKMKTTEDQYVSPLPDDKESFSADGPKPSGRYVELLPVEIAPLDTTASKPSGNNDWYVIALILLAAVTILSTLLVGLGFRRYRRLRRNRDINMVYNASTSRMIPMRRFDRPSSGEYDITPTATPNIYDTIEGADANDDVEAQTMMPRNQSDPQMTQCYSGLTVAMAIASSPYDTLDKFSKMDHLNLEVDPAEAMCEEERYTTPVSQAGFRKPNPMNSSDYLQMVGSVKKSVSTVAPMCTVASSNDSDEDNYPDGNVKAFTKDSDDYLNPGPKTSDDCPALYTLVDDKNVGPK